MKTDYSKLVCPNDKKHTLRTSQDQRYSNVWCDHCKDGWKLSDIQLAKQEKNKEFLVQNLLKQGDYEFAYICITPEVKARLLDARDKIKSINPNFSLKIPGNTFPIGKVMERLIFENDPTESYREEMESKLQSGSGTMIKMQDVKNSISFKKCQSKDISEFRSLDCSIEVGIQGIVIKHDDGDQYSKFQLPIITWKSLE